MLVLQQVDRGPGIAPLWRRPHCVLWRPPLRWFSVAWRSLTVDRASHRLPDLSSWIGGMLTPVISSQAPHHRLLSPATHGPLHGPLVAVDVNHPYVILPGECQEGQSVWQTVSATTADPDHGDPYGEEYGYPIQWRSWVIYFH